MLHPSDGLAGPREAWQIPRKRRIERLLGAFRIVAGTVGVYFVYALAEDPSWAAVGAMLVAFSALLPAYFWCKGSVPGVPLFPLFAFMYLWTYAYPLVSGHPIVKLYSDGAALMASLTVSGCLLLGTSIWLLVVRVPYRPRGRIREMVPGKGDYLFCAAIFMAAIFNMGVVGQWLEIAPGVFSIVRAVLLAISSVGIFALAYRWGKGELKGEKKYVFLVSLATYLVGSTVTLYLVGGIVASLLATVAYATGNRRVPWGSGIALIALFATLHAGKGEMREQYWYPEPTPVQLWSYPSFFATWIGNGLASVASDATGEPSQPLYERVSLVHLLLKVQDESPDRVPYLHGDTYTIIPELLIPRIFYPEKIAAHEGTTRLNIQYGIQTRDETEETTIGWGLLNEAIANFGFAGILLFGMATGGLYGWITRVTADAPILSLRMLVAITFMVFCVQTEFTAGVYVSALFQSLVSVLALSIVFMDRRKSSGARLF